MRRKQNKHSWLTPFSLQKVDLEGEKPVRHQPDTSQVCRKEGKTDKFTYL